MWIRASKGLIYIVFTHVASIYANLVGQKKAFTWEKTSTPRGFSGYNNMAAVSLFWNTNMAAVKTLYRRPWLVLVSIKPLPNGAQGVMGRRKVGNRCCVYFSSHRSNRYSTFLTHFLEEARTHICHPRFCQVHLHSIQYNNSPLIGAAIVMAIHSSHVSPWSAISSERNSFSLAVLITRRAAPNCWHFCVP